LPGARQLATARCGGTYWRSVPRCVTIVHWHRHSSRCTGHGSGTWEPLHQGGRSGRALRRSIWGPPSFGL